MSVRCNATQDCAAHFNWHPSLRLRLRNEGLYRRNESLYPCDSPASSHLGRAFNCNDREWRGPELAGAATIEQPQMWFGGRAPRRGSKRLIEQTAVAIRP